MPTTSWLERNTAEWEAFWQRASGPTSTLLADVDGLIGPSEKQALFLEQMHKRRYLLYGGAAGPGKSYILRWALIKLHLHWAQQGIHNVRTGLFCEDYPTLKDRQISRMKREFPRWLGEVKETRDEGLGFYIHPEHGGGLIALRNLDDPSKYASSEFAAIGVDELTKNDRQTFDDLRFRLRWPGISHNPFLAATNPGSIGHAWVKQLWVDRDFTGDNAAIQPEWVEFIRALPRDNDFLPETYMETLQSLPEALRRAMLDGDWNVFSGQVFSEWREGYHVVKLDTASIPEDWTRWVAIDYGYVAPFCALWFAMSPDKRLIIVYRELYETGWSARRQASAIRAESVGEKVQLHAADPSMWQKREGLSGDTFADEYRIEGIHLIKANNDRMAGLGYVHDALAWETPFPLRGEMGPATPKRPRLVIHEGCTNLIRTLPALPYDKFKVEDVDTNAEDHSYDALRYGLALEKQPPTEGFRPVKVGYKGTEAPMSETRRKHLARVGHA